MLIAPTGLARLLAAHGFADAEERPFPNDGWSGSRLTVVKRDGRRAIVKRTSADLDWIVRATDDSTLREAWLAAGALSLPTGVVAPYLGVVRERDGAALLMPDLSDDLVSWVEDAPPIHPQVVERVVAAQAQLHATAWWPTDAPPPWCPLDLRLTLLTRAAAERYVAEGNPVGERFLAGWAAFDAQAPLEARALIEHLSVDPSLLLRALAALPSVGLHGDMKLANVALLPDGDVALIDWQLTLSAPVAVELGWLLVSNVALLPEPPEAILERYRVRAPDAVVGDWAAQVDLAWIVGLLLRGWRKGLDAQSGTRTGWGASGGDDLAWWCQHAVEAASRRL